MKDTSKMSYVSRALDWLNISDSNTFHKSFNGLYRITTDKTVQIYTTKSKIWKYTPDWLNRFALKFRKPDHVFNNVKLSSVSFDNQETNDDPRQVEVVFSYDDYKADSKDYH